MTDEELIHEGSKLSTKIILYICDEVNRIKGACDSDRDGIILVALIRVIATKILHRSNSQDEANDIFDNFLKALVESWGSLPYDEINRKPH